MIILKIIKNTVILLNMISKYSKKKMIFKTFKQLEYWIMDISPHDTFYY